MFSNTRQFAQAMRKVEDDMKAAQQTQLAEWKKKADAAVDRVHAICDDLEKKYDLKQRDATDP